MARLSPALLLLPLAVWSCTGSAAPEPSEIRVRNTSDVVMEDVVFEFPHDHRSPGDPVEPADAEFGEVDYGTLPPRSVTPYRTILKAYSYAPVRVTVDGQDMALHPDDYVGENPLGSGRYTYELHYREGALSLTLARD